MSTPTTHTDEILLLAETLGEVKSRTEKLESEFSAQARPLEAATTALQAALAGIKSLQFHVLDNNLGQLSARVEQYRATIAEQVEVIATELKRADDENAKKSGEAADGLRAELAALRENLGIVVTQFGQQLERVQLEATQKAKEFAAIPGPVGPAGRSIKGRGQYVAGNRYSAGDVVSFVGGSYLSNDDDNDEKPGAKAKRWTQLVGRGPGGGVSDVKGLTGISQNLIAWLADPTSALSIGALTASGNLTLTGAVLLGGATGGMPSAGVINAKGFKIDGVDVGSSTDTFWESSGGGIAYSAGPVALGGATQQLILGASTETMTLAVTALGAGSITPKTTLTLQSGGASVVLGGAANGNFIITPTSAGGEGQEFVQVEAVFDGTQTSNLYGIRVRNTLANAGTTENIEWANAAVLGEVTTESDNAHSYSNRQHGLYGYVNHQGAGQFGLALGVWGVVAARGAGGIGIGRAFDAHMFTENVAGTGAVTSYTGFHMRSCTATGGTIGTIYGLYVDEQTAASANWAIYTAGATASYFGGNVTMARSLEICTAENTNFDLGADARASNVTIRLNTAAGKNRSFGYYSAGVLRWFQSVDFVAESGANAGSDWSLSCYADNGSFIATALKFTRATGAAQFGGPVTLPGGLVTYGANDSGGAGYRVLLVPNA